MKESLYTENDVGTHIRTDTHHMKSHFLSNIGDCIFHYLVTWETWANLVIFTYYFMDKQNLR